MKAWLISILLIPACLQAQSGYFEVMNYNEFESHYLTKSDSTIVFNFWATWCKPCVKEMPYFLKMAEEHPEWKLILVSLDFPQHFKSRLRPFLVDKDIMNEVVVLDESNANTYIDQIDPDWQGSIPATLIWNNQKVGFVEKEFHTYEELIAFIEQSIKSKQ